MMWQCRAINYKPCTPQVGKTDSRGGYAHVGQRIYNPNTVVVIDVSISIIIVIIIILASLKVLVSC